MADFCHHAQDLRSSFFLYTAVGLLQSQCLNSANLSFIATDFTFTSVILIFAMILKYYPLNTLSRLTPLWAAIVRASRISFNAAIVAFTKL